MASYGKLWSGITESSLWGGSKEARLLFVTLLAKADSTGFIDAIRKVPTMVAPAPRMGRMADVPSKTVTIESATILK